MQPDRATRRGQGGDRTAHEQMGLPKAGQGIHLDCGLIVVAQQLHGKLSVSQGGALVALEYRQAAVCEGPETGETPVLVTFARCRVGLGKVTVGRVQMAHLHFPERHDEQECVEPCPRTGADVDIAGFEEQPTGAPVQPEVAVRDAEVVRDGGLSFEVTGRVECRERLIQEPQSGAEIGLVERQHVESVAGAVEVATTPAQCQRLTRCPIGFGGMSQFALRGGNGPQRAPLAGGLRQSCVRPGCLRRVLDRLVADSFAELRFAQPKQAHRDQRRLLALARGFERGRRGADGSFEVALAHLDQRLPVLRLRLEAPPSSRRVARSDHRGGVGGSAVEVALRDEAFRAEVKKIESGFRRRGRDAASADGGEVDGPRMPARPRQVPDTLRRQGRLFRAWLRCALPSRSLLFPRIRHELLEVSIPLPRFPAATNVVGTDGLCASGAAQTRNGEQRTG